MTTVQQQVQWGTLTITLDTHRFERAYTMGREHYFDTIKDEPHSIHAMTVHQVMRLVAIPDGKGGYQFDDNPNDVEGILGFTLGYMSGPMLPETAEERDARVERYERYTKHVSASVVHAA